MIVNELHYEELRRKVVELLLAEREKEFFCHLQFVAMIGARLASALGADRHVVELASLLHDIGRDREVGEETHEMSGARITQEILAESQIDCGRREHIIRCVLNHKGSKPLASLEEEVVVSADGGSKFWRIIPITIRLSRTGGCKGVHVPNNHAIDL